MPLVTFIENMGYSKIMDFKESLLIDLNEMEKVYNEVMFSELFTDEEKREFENEMLEIKDILSYLGD